MPDAQIYSYGPLAEINAATWVIFACTSHATETNASKFPSKGHLTEIEVELTGGDGAGAAIGGSISMKASWDAAGDHIAIPVTTAAITPGVTNPTTKGGAVFSVDREYKRPNNAVAGTFYVALLLSASTADAQVRVNGRR